MRAFAVEQNSHIGGELEEMEERLINLLKENKECHSKVMKQLTLVSKVLQNLSNKVDKSPKPETDEIEEIKLKTHGDKNKTTVDKFKGPSTPVVKNYVCAQCNFKATNLDDLKMHDETYHVRNISFEKDLNHKNELKANQKEIQPRRQRHMYRL